MKHSPKEKDLFIKTASGSSIILIITVITTIINFSLKTIISNKFGPEGYGLISLGLMILNFSALISLVGTHNSLGKFIPKYLSSNSLKKVKSTLKTTFSISIPFSIIISLLIISLSNYISNNIFHEPSLQKIIIIFALAIPANSIFWTTNSTFIAFNKPQINFFSNTISKQTVQLIIVLTIIFISGSIISIAWSYLISLYFGAIISLLILFKKIIPKLNKKTNENTISSKKEKEFNFKEVLYFSLPLLLSGIFMNIMSWADTFFLGKILTIKDVGIYNIALSLALTLKLFYSSFSSMFYPISSSIIKKNKSENISLEEKKKFSNLYSKTSSWILMTIISPAIFLIFFPEKSITIIFGNSFAPGALTLIILTSGVLFDTLIGPTTQSLMALSKTKKIFYVNSFSAITNIILNITLIPIFGIIGAAISTSLTIMIRELIFFIEIRKDIPIKFNLKKSLRIIFSVIPAIIMGYKLMQNTNNLFSLIISSLLVFIVYCIILFMIKGIDKEDFTIIKHIINKKT